jgi:hypothetical protein
MRTIEEIKSQIGVQIKKVGIDGGYGALLYLHGTASRPACVVFSSGGGWEHAFPYLTPTERQRGKKCAG